MYLDVSGVCRLGRGGLYLSLSLCLCLCLPMTVSVSASLPVTVSVSSVSVLCMCADCLPACPTYLPVSPFLASVYLSACLSICLLVCPSAARMSAWCVFADCMPVPRAKLKESASRANLLLISCETFAKHVVDEMSGQVKEAWPQSMKHIRNALPSKDARQLFRCGHASAGAGRAPPLGLWCVGPGLLLRMLCQYQVAPVARLLQ